MINFCKSDTHDKKSALHLICLLSVLLLLAVPVYADEASCSVFGGYLNSFDDNEQKTMKIRIPELHDLYKQQKVQIIDIRTSKEYSALHLSLATHIPINELPQRLSELDRNKIVVTVCKTYIRAAIARTYLVLNGFESKYLVDGVSELSEYLNAGQGKHFIEKTDNK